MEDLNKFLMEVVGNCSKCKECAHRFDVCLCFFAYKCVSNDFSFFRKS